MTARAIFIIIIRKIKEVGTYILKAPYQTDKLHVSAVLVMK